MFAENQVSKPYSGLYKEIGAGGYSRVAGTVEFYLRIASLMPPDAVALDLGAGRGRLHESAAAHTLTKIIDLPSRTSRLVGADVDPIVFENTWVQERVLIDANGKVPLGDEQFDIIWSDWVLEHIEFPEVFAAETHRLLKKGGWFCARTPNKWGLTGLGARALPTQVKKRLIAAKQGGRTEDDVFPTHYRMNTRSVLDQAFPQSQWEDFTYITNAEPPYLDGPVLGRAIQLLWRLLPEAFYTNLMIFKRKR